MFSAVKQEVLISQLLSGNCICETAARFMMDFSLILDVFSDRVILEVGKDLLSWQYEMCC